MANSTRAKLVFCLRTEYDRRDEAGAVGWLYCDQRDALRIARQIDEFGEIDDPPENIEIHANGGTMTGGHGVLIQYASGRKKMVHVE